MEIVVVVMGALVVAVLAAVAFTLRSGRRLKAPTEELEAPAGGRKAKPAKLPVASGPSDVLEPPAGPEEDVDRQAAELVAEAEALLAEALRAEAEAAAAEPAAAEPAASGAEHSAADAEAAPRPRLRDRLGKARGLLAGYLGSVRAREKIDDDTWDDLEEALVRADVGVATASALLDDLRRRVRSEGISSPDELLEALKSDLKKSLVMADRSLRYEPGTPNVWLFVGVNGVGKTTTIGKVGARQCAEGRSVIMAAGDTFRAAAAEQLELWSKRAGAQFVRGNEGGDPGAVVFDAVERAAARNVDLVLADTAGRLHNKSNLMEELRKVRRVAEKAPGQVTEVLLVIDATTGQNGLVQARQFTEAVDVTGIVLTKLDGTAKGGIALAIQTDLGIPIKLVGLGETADDLVAFDPDEFVDALFS